MKKYSSPECQEWQSIVCAGMIASSQDDGTRTDDYDVDYVDPEFQ